MSEEYDIPVHAKAKAAFAGVELEQAWPFLMSLFVGLIAGRFLGFEWAGYIGIPVLGFFGNRIWIDFKAKHLPGYVGVVLYQLGLSGYSDALNKQEKRFIGDAVPVNKTVIVAPAAPLSEGDKA